MRIDCSFCKKELAEKEPFNDGRVSHGVCPKCYAYFDGQLRSMSLDEYLGAFQEPVLIFNAEGRVVASNTIAGAMYGRDTSGQLLGLLGGEALECSYARLPEGCGKTYHCPTCTIRNLVRQTLQSQKDSIDMVVILETDCGCRQLTVSAFYVSGMVCLLIDESNSAIDQGAKSL